MIRKPLYIMFFAALNFFYISSAQACFFCCFDSDDDMSAKTASANSAEQKQNPSDTTTNTNQKNIISQGSNPSVRTQYLEPGSAQVTRTQSTGQITPNQNNESIPPINSISIKQPEQYIADNPEIIVIQRGRKLSDDNLYDTEQMMPHEVKEGQVMGSANDDNPGDHYRDIVNVLSELKVFKSF